MLQGERPECLPIVIKQQIESVFDPFQALAISQLSANLTRERSSWNQPNHTWHLHPIARIETNPKVSVIGVFYPGSSASNARSTQEACAECDAQAVFLLRASIASPLSCSMEFAFDNEQ